MRIKEQITKVWVYGMGFLVIGIILFLFIYIFLQGRHAITVEFLTGLPRGVVIGTEGGILPAIVGSLYYAGLACIFASLLGIATAIYLVYYCHKKRLAVLVQLVLQCMAGIPSIVLGLFGYTMFVLYMDMGRSILAGSLTLGIMILPFIAVRVEKALQEMNASMVHASYALGVSKFYTIRKIVWSQCQGELISSIVLGGCYAIGAAAPLIFTGAVIASPVPKSVFEPSMALPYHLYMLLTQGVSAEKAYGTAFVLMAIVLITNGLALLYGLRKGK